jgi:hypothetical protein
MASPFDNVLTGLHQIDADLVYRTQALLTLMTAMPTQVTQALIKAKTDNLDVPLSDLVAALGGGTLTDTGTILLTAAVMTPIAVTIRGRHLWAVNVSTNATYLTVTDGDGNEYLKAFELVPGAYLNADLGGLSFSNGLKWHADVDSQIRAQFLGY